MEETETLIGNIKAVQEGDSFGIKSTESPWALSYYFTDIYDEKAIKKFITHTEKLIRTSREYKAYIELLRTNVGALNHDTIMNNITTQDVDLEFHHTPLTLYDIVEAVMLKHISEEEKFTSFSIAKEVMDLHFKHYIGICPMTKTTHELAHSGNLFISASQIFGDYKKFLELYKSGLTNSALQKVRQMEEYSENGIPSDFKGLFK